MTRGLHKWLHFGPVLSFNSSLQFTLLYYFFFHPHATFILFYYNEDLMLCTLQLFSHSWSYRQKLKFHTQCINSISLSLRDTVYRFSLLSYSIFFCLFYLMYLTFLVGFWHHIYGLRFSLQSLFNHKIMILYYASLAFTIKNNINAINPFSLVVTALYFPLSFYFLITLFCNGRQIYFLGCAQK